jgi:outer membrane protein
VNPTIPQKLPKIAPDQCLQVQHGGNDKRRRNNPGLDRPAAAAPNEGFMKTLTIAAALAATTMLANPAQAAADGKIQVKVLATAVLPDGKITDLENNTIGLPVGSQTEANDNVVPTVAVEYFATPNFSVETICCLTTHGVNGAGAINGATILDHVMILPVTVTLKYHFNAGGIKPYVGAGPSVFLFIDEKPGATTASLGGTRAKLDSHVGFALQASFDGKKYFMNTRLHVFNATGTEIFTTKHKLDPWVLSGGVYFRF